MGTICKIGTGLAVAAVAAISFCGGQKIGNNFAMQRAINETMNELIYEDPAMARELIKLEDDIKKIYPAPEERVKFYQGWLTNSKSVKNTINVIR